MQRTRRLGPAIQNTAFQVSDFAVQIASGTSALQSFSQQAPQLLGGFGVVGAVVGGLVAVASALAAFLFNLGDAAEDSADATDRLADAAGRLRTLERARADVDALAEAYGRASAQARALNAAQDALANREAARALAGVIAGLDDVLGAAEGLDFSRANAPIFDLARQLRTTLRDLNPQQLVSPFSEASELLRNEDALKERLMRLARLSEEVFEAESTGNSGALDRITELLDLTEEAARRLIAAYGELRDADGFDAQAEALGKLRTALEGAANGTRDLSDGQAAALDGLLRRVAEAEESTLKLVAASGDVAPGLDDATAAAGRLADELGRALRSLATLQARAESRRRRAQIRIDFANAPDERTRRLRLEAQDEAERETLEPRVAGLRARGVTADEIDRERRALREQAGAAFDAEQAARRAEEALRELGRTGSGAGRAASREMERLALAQRRAAEEARALETATRDALRAYAG